MSDASLPVFSRDALLQALAVKPGLVNIPELGGAVYLKPLTAEQRLEFTERSQSENLPILRLMAGILPFTVSDENGNPLLTPEDVEQLEKSDYHALNALIVRVMDINGMSAKAADDLKKNSEGTVPSDSFSVLPES